MFQLQIEDSRVEQSKYGTLIAVDLHGVKVYVITPIAPTALYTRHETIKIVRDGLEQPIWLKEGLTMGDLAKAAGLKCFDCALPIGWARAEFLEKGLPFPRGVWSYDRTRIFGDFVSFEEMMILVANQLQEILGIDNLRLLSHDPTNSPVTLDDYRALCVEGVSA